MNVAEARQQPFHISYLSPKTIPYWVVHIGAIVGVFWLGFSWSGVALATALYFARMFFVTAGYHRYFSHRAFKTSRWFQMVLALGAATTVQKGIMWWAAHHRDHHRVSDEADDVHSPVQHGFWWSHHGWILSPEFDKTRLKNVPDLARYPELRWLDTYHLVPAIALAVILVLVGGMHAFVWGFLVSTTVLWHGTFTINSLSHVFGRRRYETTDDSRNSLILAIITMGEGWHNNHHHYQSSANQGFFWWEIDMTYGILKTLEVFGIVWDVRKAPAHIVEGRRKYDAESVAEAEPLLDRAA